VIISFTIQQPIYHRNNLIKVVYVLLVFPSMPSRSRPARTRNTPRPVAVCGGDGDGWKRTKKIGRDDEEIDRDRKIAIDKQRKARNIVVDETSSLIKRRTNLNPNDQRRAKKKVFAQRQLFPKDKSRRTSSPNSATSTSSNVTVNKNGDRRRKRKSNETSTVNKNGGDKHHTVKLKKKHSVASYVNTTFKKIVTPGKPDYYSSDDTNTATSRNHNHIHRRCRRKSTILFSEDFQKSAKYLYETTQRRRFKPDNKKKQREQEQEQDGQKIMREAAAIQTENNHVITRETDHLSIPPLSIDESRKLQLLSNNQQLVPIFEPQQNSTINWLNTKITGKNSGDNDYGNNNKHLPIHCDRRHSFVRELLLGTNSSNSTNEIQSPIEQIDQKFVTASIIDTKTDQENSQLSSILASDPILVYSSKRRQYPCNIVDNKDCIMKQTTTNSIFPNSKPSPSKTQLHLATQREYTGKKLQETENAKEIEQEKDDYCKTNLPDDDDDDDDDDIRTDNQSIASSVMLSLPRNTSFSPPFAIMGSNNGDGDDDVTNCIEEYPHQQPNQNVTTEKASVEEVRKNDIDPLADIAYWQTMVEKEESRGKTVKTGDFSIRHALASIVLAKNTNKKRTENNNYHNDCGFLWLPSILEGGTEML
jgi:hypothetical protein